MLWWVYVNVYMSNALNLTPQLLKEMEVEWEAKGTKEENAQMDTNKGAALHLCKRIVLIAHNEEDYTCMRIGTLTLDQK